MPGHGAGGVHTAHTGARVHALVPHTCLVSGALWVDGALRLALDIRVTKHFRKAGAGCSLVSLSALCIDATRRGVARINYLRSWGGCCDPSALAEGISSVALVADTDGHMVPDATLSVSSTEPGTGVDALLIATCLV